MATQIDILNEVAKKLGQLRKDLCCKLDNLILASGGDPVLYNNPSSEVISPGDTYSSPEIHSISMTVIGTSNTDVANVVIGGNSVTWPIGFTLNMEATTTFEPGNFQVEDTSTASVIINTITS